MSGRMILFEKLGRDGLTDETTTLLSAATPPPRDGAGRNAFGFSGSAQKIATLVHRRLRDDILSLALKPGTVVSENELSAVYGIGRTPVREALLRLSDEGLVEVVPKSGTRVTRIPASRLPEAILVRKSLEDITTRAAAECASISDLMGLRMLIQRQREAAEQANEAAFHAADEAFHAQIARAAGYPGIWVLVQQVKAQVDRYRRLTLPQKGRMARVQKDHEAVLAGLEARDCAAAAAAMAAHIDQLRLDIGAIRSLHPDYFTDETDADRRSDMRESSGG
ncbi:MULTISPECIES: GntR family transcriptional regulator [unclassified Mesorhizobium]|uniref:GntR family transcriptional regulator n=1 Tax=unclassified Mesorhizobium TaxID=325217 RepID=UPI001CD0AD51|nr:MULTISPECIES: GntR family transcriptional regulator [unclassified Mesorhizobium]MBZ9974276.1 GntR family transcriptional regulator [Mesorhizobium sp. BR-1-1-10]